MGLENKNFYWMIEWYSVNWIEKVCQLKLLGWESYADRVANPGKPMVQSHFMLAGDAFDLDQKKALTEQLYLKVKTADKWTAAQDVIEDKP